MACNRYIFTLSSYFGLILQAVKIYTLLWSSQSKLVALSELNHWNGLHILHVFCMHHIYNPGQGPDLGPLNRVIVALLYDALKRQSWLCNRLWRPIGLWDIEAPTFSGQSAHRWQSDCRPHAPAALYTWEDFWYSFLLEAKSTPGP
jgi:hypothetical protein